MRAVVLALTLALVASHQINLVPEFPVDKTFVFRYEGLLLSGLPQKGLAKAGIKVSSKVLIKASKPDLLLMELREPKLYEYTGYWPKGDFNHAAKLTAEINEQLVTPIKFEYANGVVGKIFAPRQVSATVLNLHRGILNILQLNLKNTQNVYELHEAGPQGACKTHYMISEDATHQISVRKSKDLTNCHERVIKDFGLAHTETCAECQQRLKSLTGTATFSYTMKTSDSKSGVEIFKAVVNELYQFSLLNTVTGTAEIKANQSLTSVTDSTATMSSPKGDYMVRGSLRYEFANEILQLPIQLLRINDAKTQIKEVLQQLVKNNVAMVHEDAPLKFIQLVQLMRVASFETINNIWSEFNSKPLYRRWILDAISAVGTPVGLKVIRENIQNIAVSELIQTLPVALHMVTANSEAIDETAYLAFKSKVKDIPVLREMVMLGYGSMIAKYCAEVHTCPDDLVKPIHGMVTDAISKPDIPKIILALKVMGNAGHISSLKTIMKLLPGFGKDAASMPMKVQLVATLALRNIAKKEPKLVQPVALQLFMDNTLHPELRMISCIVLFETKPSVALMATLGAALERESNMHVVSFAYSHIKSLTRSMAPDYMHVAAAANVAMRMLRCKLDRLSNYFSRAIRYDFYISPFMVGAAGSAFLINDAATNLPRSFVTRARAYLAGAAADVLEVGVRIEGLHDALVKAHAADESADRNTKISRTLKALMDWKSMPTNKPLASIYVKVLGQEIAFAHITKTFIDNVILEQATQTGVQSRAREMFKKAVNALQKSITFQYAKPILASEVRRILPSSLGVPVELGYYTAAVASAELQVQAHVTPSLPEDSEKLTLNQLMKTNFALDVEARPSVVLESFAVVGVNTAFIQASVMARGKIRTVVPGKLSIKADLPKGSVKLELLPTAVPDNIAAVNFETVAVTRNIADLPAENVVSLAPPVPSDAAQRLIPASVQRTMCGVIPHIRIKACLEVASKNAGYMELNPLYYTVGRHSARMSVARGDGPAIERLEFEVQVGPNAAEKLSKEIADVENSKESTILLKLREILEAGLRNINSSSSSSSSSGSSSSSSVSSSMSSSSSRSTQNKNTYGLFGKFNKDQNMASQGASKTSSSSSIEAIQRKARLLGDAISPVFAIMARAIRADQKSGYQIAVYLDKQTSRVQVVFDSISANDKWKLCADGILSRKHKVAARFAYGEQCQECSVSVKAETGLHESNPAARLKIDWDKAPRITDSVISNIKRARDYIVKIAPMVGINAVKTDNKERKFELICALPSRESLNVIIRVPTMTLSKPALYLPYALPIERDGSIPDLKNLNIRAIIEKWWNDIRES